MAYVCQPVRLNSEDDLSEMMRFSEKTLATYNGDCATTDGSLRGLSCSVSLPLMTKPWLGAVYFHVQYFGDQLDDALKHVEVQLRHVAAEHRGHSIMFRICFPSCIDMITAADKISRDILSGLEPVISERAFLTSVDVGS